MLFLVWRHFVFWRLLNVLTVIASFIAVARVEYILSTLHDHRRARKAIKKWFGWIVLLEIVAFILEMLFNHYGWG